MIKEVKGIPESEYIYEFSILEDKGEYYQWIANFEYYTDEVTKMLKTNDKYIVSHDVRVAHKVRKEDYGRV